MKSVNRPNKVEVPVNKLYPHDLSHRHTTTLDWFRLQPVFCQDMLPGDKMAVDIRSIIQSAPMATQVFGGAHLDLHAFFVPNRILWDNWDSYITRLDAGSEFTPPYFNMEDITAPGDGASNIKDYRRVFSSLGYPTYSNSNVSNFPFTAFQARAYWRIWYDYYMDSQNINYSWLSPDIGSGHADTEILMPLYRCFKKDFITTLLSHPEAPISYLMGSAKGSMVSDGSFSKAQVLPVVGNYTGLFGLESGTATSASGTKLSPSISASAMRGAVAIQRFLERMNVSGTRPVERLLSMMGVKPSVERLNMSEFIGSQTIKVNIDGLVNTGSNEEVSSDSQSPGMNNAWGVKNNNGSVGVNHFGQGYQSGYASGSGQTDKFHYTATEHGFFIIIASLIPEYCNPNSVSRQFFRGVSTPEPSSFDYFTPDLDGIGYQEMMMSEVCLPTIIDTNNNDNWLIDYDPYQVVGYQPMYEDYRFVQDRLSGDFLDPDSGVALRNMVFVRSLPDALDPEAVTAGVNLTTSSFADRASFDRHFQIADSSLDHFVLHMYIVNDAQRPVTNNQLPTELSDMANSYMEEISNGGVRL